MFKNKIIEKKIHAFIFCQELLQQQLQQQRY